MTSDKMHFLTSVFGSEYLPFLRACLASIRETHPESPVTVVWDDLPDIELHLLRLSFPTVRFVASEASTEEYEAKNVRISLKMRLWSELLHLAGDGEIACFIDSDVLVMQGLQDVLPPAADVVFTWKPERFTLNTGVLIARIGAATRAFFDEWIADSNAVIRDEMLLAEALQRFGGGDQYALARVLETADYTSPFTRTFEGMDVRFSPVPCQLLNETRSRPIDDTTRIFHLKGGWHPILLERGPYTPWRTEDACRDVAGHWRRLELDARLGSWRSFVLDAAAAHESGFPSSGVAEHVERGILNSEMLAVIALIHELDIEVIVESGRYLGHSTKALAEATKGTGRIIHSTELVRDAIAERAEERLRGYDHLRLHYGDAAEVLPRVLDSNKGRRTAILLDGPKGPDAFDLFADAIALHPGVVVGFVHDLRASYPEMLNPNSILVHEWFERVFLTDDEEYVERFRHLDESCKHPGLWEPYHLLRMRIGSYGPTLGAILPTAGDRLRARRRLEARAREDTRDEGGNPAERESPERVSIRHRLHRVPGFMQAKRIGKRFLGRPISTAAGLTKPAASRGDGNRASPFVSKGKNPAAAQKALRDAVEVGRDDIIIDCGANVGDVVAEFVDSGAMIYAFEPNPHAFQVLAARFAGRTNVICFPLAVWDRSATVRLFMHHRSAEDEVRWSVGSSMLEYKTNVQPERYVEVEAIDLSEFVFRITQRVKLLKMDIEGAEYETLTRLIERGQAEKIDHIVVETHEGKIPQLRERHARFQEVVKARGLENIDLEWI